MITFKREMTMAKDIEKQNDDKVDALIAVILITAVVAGAVYWLSGMPA
jgi:hypothetical protein